MKLKFFLLFLQKVQLGKKCNNGVGMQEFGDINVGVSVTLALTNEDIFSHEKIMV